MARSDSRSRTLSRSESPELPDKEGGCSDSASAGVSRRELAWVALLYLLASFLATYPLGFWIGREFPVGGDSWQNVWNLWWTRTAVLGAKYDLLSCPVIFHPGGLSLALHSNSYFNTFLSIPFQGLLSIETLHSLSLWIYFPASAIAAYGLARRWVRSPLAAFLAGWIFAFSPYRMERYAVEQIDLVSTAFIPLFVLFLLKYLSKPKVSAALSASFFLLLQMLSSWYSGAFCMLFFLFAVLYYWLGDALPRGARRFWLGLGAIVVIPIVVMLPLIVPMLKDLSSPLYSRHVDQLQVSKATSSDLLAFVTPGVLIPSFLQQTTGWHGPLPRSVLDALSARILEGRGSNVLEATSYVGWVNLAIILVFWAGWKRRSLSGPRSGLQKRAARFWTVAAVVFGVLALGPILQIAGWQTRVPLPYALINAIPGFSVLRAPVRLSLLVMLAVGMVVALALDCWWRAGRKRLVLALAVLIAVDLAVVPLHRLYEGQPVPAVYAEIAEDNVPGVVLEVPSGYEFPSYWYNVRAMYYQTRHHRPLLVGYISRTPIDPYGLLEDYPIIRALSFESLTGESPPDQIDMERARADLATLGVRYVIVHPGDLTYEAGGDEAVAARVRGMLEAMFGPAVFDDGETLAFRSDPEAEQK